MCCKKFKNEKRIYEMKLVEYIQPVMSVTTDPEELRPQH